MVSGCTIIVLATVSKGFSKTDHAAQLILLLAEVAVEDFPTASPTKVEKWGGGGGGGQRGAAATSLFPIPSCQSKATTLVIS